MRPGAPSHWLHGESAQVEPGGPGSESQLLLLSCVSWGRPFCLSLPQFLHQYSRAKNAAVKAVVRMGWDGVGQVPGSGPALWSALNPRLLPLKLPARFF